MPCFPPAQLRQPLTAVPVPGPTRRLHSHDGLAPHYHEPLVSPGDFNARPRPLARDYGHRSFTVGIGGPVGTGKTALMLQLCRALRDSYNIATARARPRPLARARPCRRPIAGRLLGKSLLRTRSVAPVGGQVTNDIFTREDGEFLLRHEALAAERIRAVETGGCPHAAIREDIACNIAPLEELTALFSTELLLLESGGDNLAANFSRELADYIIYVIDVAGGDKIPRKGGPGITQARRRHRAAAAAAVRVLGHSFSAVGWCGGRPLGPLQADLLIINKTDLADAVGADLEARLRAAAAVSCAALSRQSCCGGAL